MNYKNPVLILFGDNTVSYNIASIVDKNNFTPIGLLPSNVSKLNVGSINFKTLKVSKHHQDSSEYLKELIEYVKSFNSKVRIPVLFANDQALDFWVKNKNELNEYIHFPTENLSIFYNKNEFFEKLKLVIPENIPKSSTISGVKELTFPIIAKPAYKDSSNKFYKKFNSKVVTIESEEQLVMLSSFDDKELILQEKLVFDLGDEYSNWLIALSDGSVSQYQARCLNKYPNLTGRIARIGFSKNKNIEEISKKVIEKLEYKGIGDIQFIYCQLRKKFFVIEMNPRLWCSHEIFEMNSVSFINRYLCDYYQMNNKEDELVKNQQWISSLFNLLRPGIRFENDEFYGAEREGVMFRAKIFIYLTLKLFYYHFKQRKMIIKQDLEYE